MQEILEAILKGAAQQAQAGPASQGRSVPRGQTGGDAMMDILGSILGEMSGASSQPTRPAQSAQPGGADLIGDILGGVLGGGSSGQNSGAISDLLGAVLGGSSRSSATNPLVKVLADKLGIPPVIAQMVVSYFMAKMVAGKMGVTGGSAGFQPGSTPGNPLDLDHLLSDADDDDALQSNLMNSGMPQELARHANIDQETALRSLQEVVKAVAGERARPQPVTTRQADLKGLLDSW